MAYQTKTVTAKHLEITTDVYGDYNRHLFIVTDEGAFEGVVREKDCGGFDVGEYADVQVTVAVFFSGRTLVSGVNCRGRYPRVR